MSEMSEEKLEMPPSEKKAINQMADKFKAAMGATAQASQANDKPASAAPAAEQPATPPEQTTPKQPSDKQMLNWRELERVKDQFKAEAQQYKAELEKIKKTTPVNPEEVEKLKAEHEQVKRSLAERDQIVQQFAVEKHPAFQKYYSERIGAVISEAKESAGADYAADVEEILKAPPSAQRDKQIQILSEELSDFSRTALVNAVTELRRVEKERESELAKAPENIKLLQEFQARRVEAERLKLAQDRALLLNHINVQIQDDLATADPATAKTIRGNLERFIKGESDTAHYTETLTAAAKWQRYEPVLKEKNELIEKLNAQLQELQGAQPSLQRSAAAPAPKKAQTAPDNTDLGPKFRQLRDGGRPQPSYQAA